MAKADYERQTAEGEKIMIKETIIYGNQLCEIVRKEERGDQDQTFRYIIKKPILTLFGKVLVWWTVKTHYTVYFGGTHTVVK